MEYTRNTISTGLKSIALAGILPVLSAVTYAGEEADYRSPPIQTPPVPAQSAPAIPGPQSPTVPYTPPGSNTSGVPAATHPSSAVGLKSSPEYLTLAKQYETTLENLEKAKAKQAETVDENDSLREDIADLHVVKSDLEKKLDETDYAYGKYVAEEPERLFNERYAAARVITEENLTPAKIHETITGPDGYTEVPMFNEEEKRYLAVLAGMQTLLLETELMYAGKDQTISTRGMEKYQVKRSWFGQLITLGLDPYKEKKREGRIPVLSERLDEPRAQGNLYLTHDTVFRQFNRVEDVTDDVRFQASQMGPTGQLTHGDALMVAANKNILATAFGILHGGQYKNKGAFESARAAYIANDNLNRETINEVIDALQDTQGPGSTLGSDFNRYRKLFAAGVIEFGVDGTMWLPASQQMEQMYGLTDGQYHLGPSSRGARNPLIQASEHSANNPDTRSERVFQPEKKKRGILSIFKKRGGR